MAITWNLVIYTYYLGGLPNVGYFNLNPSGEEALGSKMSDIFADQATPYGTLVPPPPSRDLSDHVNFVRQELFEKYKNSIKTTTIRAST